MKRKSRCYEKLKGVLKLGGGRWAELQKDEKTAEPCKREEFAPTVKPLAIIKTNSQ